MKRIVLYQASSGNQYILNGNYEMVLKSISFNEVEWSYEGVNRQYGTALSALTKNVLEVELEMRFNGRTPRDIFTTIHPLLNDMDRDKATMQVGKLFIITSADGSLDDRSIISKEYINGYFIKRNVDDIENISSLDGEFTFMAPWPFWIEQFSGHFESGSSHPTEAFLDYNYDYNYDYTPDDNGNRAWNVDHYASSDFLMTIYGPCVDPEIYINGYKYKVNVTLEQDEIETSLVETLTIDSVNFLVQHRLLNGDVENAYNLRDKENYIFNKIPGGLLDVTWSGDFDFDILLYLERSEPKWKLS